MVSMASSLHLFILIIVAFIATTLADFVSHADPIYIAAKRQDAVERWSHSVRRGGAGLSKRAAPAVRNITFSNPQASQFYVDGSTLPEVDYDIGPSWSGLLPISDKPDETRQLFFWFFPPGPEGSVDDLIFWTNGGPGCSSLAGAFQENGPVTWGFGQAKPTLNEWSWTNLSSILYVEQPVGTGYSQGVPDAADENVVAEELVGFLQQFFSVFSELKGKNFYLTGESYAGVYVPYIADYIYRDTSVLDVSLKGIWISDPVIGWDVVQTQIPAVNFVHKYENVFAFNQSFMAELDGIARRCNYSDYMDRYLRYPPRGQFRFPSATPWPVLSDGCDVWTTIFEAALLVNPAFNMYRIFDVFPVLWDVLGFPGSFAHEQVSPVYFDRADVKAALHAPADATWTVCSSNPVFPVGDWSLRPAYSVLPSVIEKSERSVIVHGMADYIVIAEGTRIVLQNMTWAGKQGFQEDPVADSFIVDGMGSMGNVQSERGLTYYEIALCGHMVPQFSPVAAFQSMQYLMGFRENP